MEYLSKEMKKLLNWKFFLLLIVLVAGFLRFYNLGTNPPSLTWDEASWGYNAYSLGIDGKDEFGRFLPYTYLESFGDYKPPLYAYLDIIPVKVFGLNEFSTRFPSALFGTLAVLLTYFLVKRIFRENHKPARNALQSDSDRSSIVNHKSEAIALLSALFLAISPWHTLLSRAAFEANVASFFIIFGVWAFLAAVQEKKWYLILSAISFALTFYVFNTARIVSPILVLLLAFAFREKLISMKKVTVVAFIFGVLVFLPTLSFLLTPQAGLRFKEVNIFSDRGIVEGSNWQIEHDNNAFWSKIIHNRRLAFTAEYLKHYLDNLNPSFLFIKGDANPKFSTQTVGQMYIWDIVFFAGGILLLIRKREGNWWLIPLWLLIGIIPAGLARETPHALRIESTLPTFQILVAYGVVQLLDLLKSRKKEIAVFLFVLLFINFVYFYHDYFYNYRYDYSRDWQYGYKESIDYVKSVENNYDYIQVTNYLGRPYIYYLFYTKTNPEVFRKTASVTRDVFGFVQVSGFGKYLFPQNYNHSLNSGKKVLYINASNGVPDNAKVLKKFHLLNGEEELTAYTI